MQPKEIVREFYQLDLAKDKEKVLSYFSDDCILNWNSSKGFNTFNKNQIQLFFEGISQSYESLRVELSHLLQDENMVTVRHTSYVRTIENPEIEEALAHYMSIWEVKDGKLYRGYEVSQLADVSEESLNSFSEIKV